MNEWDEGWKEQIITTICNTAVNVSWREVQESFWQSERDKNPTKNYYVED